jgi:hypothetical protein
VLADVGIGPISIPTPGDLVTALKNAVVEVADKVFEKIIEWIAGLLADAVSKVTEALVILLRAIKPTLTPGGTITRSCRVAVGCVLFVSHHSRCHHRPRRTIHAGNDC